jgi:hypothetical protein
MRTRYLITALLSAFAAVICAADTAVAMPPPPGPAWPSYVPPPLPVQRPATVTTYTPLWPYFLVGIAAVFITLAAVALINLARSHHSAHLRTA